MKRTLGLISLILLVTACASGPRARTAPELPSVEVPNLEERALLLLLVDRQAYDDFVVQQALRGDASLREDLAVALGRIPDRQGLSALQGLLVDDLPAVRRAAAFCLGLLGDPKAQQALFAAARDTDRETGVLAVEALGQLGARTVDVLEALLPLPEEERWARLLPASSASRTTPSCRSPSAAWRDSGPGAPRRTPPTPWRAIPRRRPCPPCASCWPTGAAGPRLGRPRPGDRRRRGGPRGAAPAARRSRSDPGPPIQALRSARALVRRQGEAHRRLDPPAARAARRSAARRAGERRRGGGRLGIARARRCAGRRG